MQGLKMNSRTLSLLEKSEGMTILRGNDIDTTNIYDAYIIIDETLEDGVICDEPKEEREYELTEAEQEEIEVLQALWELKRQSTFVKENAEILERYINKLQGEKQ